MTPPAAPLCPRNERQRRASLLLLAAVLLGVCATCAGHPAATHCQHLKCWKEGRYDCDPGSSSCGSCRYPYEENQKGLCVSWTRREHKSSKKKTNLSPEVDEEIDYLHSVIEMQQVPQPETQKKQQSTQAAAVVSTQDVKKPESVLGPIMKQKNDIQIAKDVRNNTTTPHPAASAHPASTFQPRITRIKNRGGPADVRAHRNDSIIIIFISLCVATGTVAVIVATVCYIRMQKQSRLAQKLDYPAFTATSAPPATANSISMGDKTLAQNAQMYHYQHQKQQMLSLGKSMPEAKVLDAEATSEEEEVGGDFTVYECPGLAPTGEMEVKNPLFDDSTEQYQQNQK